MTILRADCGATLRAETARPRVDRDRELVEALRHGESSAVERLLETYGHRAYRLAIAITRHEADAEEVLQDAFWTVVRKIDMFRGEAAFATWLYRIVANAAYQKIRSRSARERDIRLDDVLPVFHDDVEHAPPVVDWSARVEEPALQAELRLVLSAALEELPAHHRVVVVLRDVEGHSNGEIAEALRISIPNVKSRVHRARLFLRKRLADYMCSHPSAG